MHKPMKNKDQIYQSVKRQFSPAAESYVTSESHARGADLDALLETAGDITGLRALDIATGGGHTAIALAKKGALVTATDLTPSMLEAAKRHAESFNVEMRYVQCAAEDLAFGAGSFDLVTCRIAPHHFADPYAFLADAARVLRPEGALLIIDNIVPEDEKLGAVINRIECWRDPSHVEAYPTSRWIVWLAEAGFELKRYDRWKKTKLFQDWTNRSKMTKESTEKLENYIKSLVQPTRTYLKVEIDNAGHIRSLAHEAALFAAVK